MGTSFHTEIANNVAWWNCGDDQTALWSDTTGYLVPPAHDFDADLGGPISNIQWDSAVAFENPPYGGDACPDAEDTALASADPTFAYSPWLAPTPSPADGGNPIASSQSDAAWAPHVPSPNGWVGEPIFDITSSTSAAPPALYQQEWAWFGTPGQFTSTAGTTPLGLAEFSAADVSAGEALSPPAAYMRGPPRSILGKRPREDDGVLEAAGPTSRARQRPTTRIPVKENNKSEAAGRGAEKLTAPSAQGIYRQPRPGPSAQGQLTGTTAQGQLRWFEWRDQGASWCHGTSAMRQPEAVNGVQDKKLEDVEGAKLIRLPRRLTQRQQALLRATSADWEHGAVRERKCRLCPDSAFGSWEDFRRHCDTMEAHPLRIAFCEYCGDFFARGDSLARHRRSRPPECLGVSQAEAEAKRRETEEAHGDFERKLEGCLKSGEEIGTPFAQSIKEKFPKSSKRGSRQQSRLKRSS